MAVIVYAGQSYACREGETVLDCLTANGVTIPSSCRVGVCQCCLMRAVKGEVAAEAQVGLKPTQVGRGYFHACKLRPQSDIEVALADDGGERLQATVMDVTPLNRDAVRVRLRPARQFDYRPGQYIRLHMDSATSRCYSLASVPGLDEHVELHVRRVVGGCVSAWVHDELKAGDAVVISEAVGDSCYAPGQAERSLCLIGTGCGLAPLYGIVRDALRLGHHGTIRLFHGAYDADGLYYADELQALADRHENFSYVTCLSDASDAAGHATGLVHEVALADIPDLSGWKVYLCGHPEMVKRAQSGAFLAGASLKDIYADPFHSMAN